MNVNMKGDIMRSNSRTRRFMLRRVRACRDKAGGLNLSKPNDPAEIEADAIADKIMRMPEREVSAKQSDVKSLGTLAHGTEAESGHIHRKCDACEQEDDENGSPAKGVAVGWWNCVAKP